MANQQKPKTPETRQKAQAGKKEKSRQGKLRSPKEGNEQSFPVVGVGASAGGVKALEMFFSKVPADCRMVSILSRKGALPDLGDRKMALNARRIDTGEKHPAMVMVSFKDLTE